MADKSITIISLPQMVDLALNSPEVGIVNFTVLHSLLHVIVNQLNLGDCNVEFRGSDSERLQNYIATAKPGPIITLTEYTIGADGKGRKKKIKKRKKSSSAIADEKGKKDENQKEKEIAILKKEEEGGSTNDTESSGSMQTIVVVEPASKDKIGETPKFTIALTKEQLGKLQKDIHVLQKQVKELTELPGNIGLIDALRTSGQGGTSPVLNMFQILTLVKRLDATEVAMNKMATMIEDLAKGQSNLAGESVGKRETQISFKEKSEDLVAKSQELRRSLDATVGGNNQIQEIIAQLKELEERITQLEETGVVSGGPEKSLKSKNTDYDVERNQSASIQRGEGESTDEVDIASTDLTTLPMQEAISILQHELINLKEYNAFNQAGIQALKEVEQLKESLMSQENNLPPDVKLGQLDIKINDLKEQVSTLDTVYHQQFSNINERAQHLENEISALWERIKQGLQGGDTAITTVNSQTVQELYNKLLQLQEDMVGLSETANKLLTEREGRQNSLDVMIEQIELLKTVKADREDLEDALADKADACQINRKVSHEQFDAAYDEITKSLEETLDKLRRQEELWLQSLNDLQKEIGNKLDKMELSPLKDFINLKLKGIQDKVKKISALKQEHEAAGTKSKLLRNVNCISCDADVVMRKQTDITLFPKPYAMPADKSPGPYLAYELDLLRKQQKGLPNSKNLNLLENAIQTGRAKSTDKDHLCNRYCGGSHTITTPQQRVMRVGHFMEQWGPEIAPVNEVLIKGTDGHLYKGRDDAALRIASAERPPTPRVEPPVLSVTEYNAGSSSQKEIKIERKSDPFPSRRMSANNKIDRKASQDIEKGITHATSEIAEKQLEIKRSQ